MSGLVQFFPRVRLLLVISGRWGIVVLAVAALVGCGGQMDAPSPALQPSEPSPVQQEPQQESPPTALSIPQPVQTLPNGMLRSGVASSGTYLANTVSAAAMSGATDVRQFVVQLETSLPESGDGAALRMHEILNSPRGWAGTHGSAFELVSDTDQADLVIHLASPQTVDLACAALNTAGLWSCRLGPNIYLNVDRWFYGTPTWAGQPIDEYRSYLINHEVGHYLGFGHVGCPAVGAPSPVMQQQSIDLNGCLPNAWPDVTGERDD